VARRSSIGVAASAAASPAARHVSASSVVPLVSSVTAGAVMMVAATLPRAIVASVTVSPSKVTDIATWTTEMACARRRPDLTNSERTSPLVRGIEMPVTSSSSASVVVRNPVMKSWSGSTRTASAEATCTVAPSAVSAEMVSLAGLAVTMLPTTVARLRSCGEPTSRHACASASASVRHVSFATTSWWVLVAPNRISSSVTTMSLVPAMRLVSIRSSTPVCAPRSSSTVRSVPPATARAAGPCSAFSASASPRVRGCDVRRHASGRPLDGMQIAHVATHARRFVKQSARIVPLFTVT
jgi:hypothetical protein